ncbi:MAG TPA: AAA family ATPase [Phycisphaerae bacterium]|nr:AAA family ATPase [Phycisphaerae bacterium]
MSDPNQLLDALRQAVALTPDNHSLRLHLAETLGNYGYWSEAEVEYKKLLAAEPRNENVKLGLANAFLQQDKNAAALVVVEEILKKSAGSAPPRTYVLHAKLLAKTGEIEYAIRQYKKGVELDRTVADESFASRYNILPPSRSSDDKDEVVDGKIRSSAGDGSDEPLCEIERPRIKFADVGGLDSVKEEIRLKIIHPLSHPELYKAYGKPIGGGILMYGPPGCGKTYLARATAGEINAAFLAIGINDVLDMWLGNSEKNLHQVFERARRNRPCVLFFDEVDALAASRADMRKSAGRHLINQFLAEMDGVKSSNDGVLILAASNAPWHVDSAFRRPGRFDRVLFIPPPDLASRIATLRILMQGKPADNLDFESIAQKAIDFTGADLKAVVDLAVEAKLQQAIKQGVPKPLTTKDLIAAAGQLKPSSRDWFATARNYALYSNQGGQYDDIVKYLRL